MAARPTLRARPIDPDALSGAQKAAVVLLALGEDHTRLWEQFDADEVREITRAMASLGPVPALTVEALLNEFAAGLGAPPPVTGSAVRMERLLNAVLTDDAREPVIADLRAATGGRFWSALGEVSEAVLATYLMREYPQTAALVLSKLESDHAGRVLTALPEDFALDCVQRMLRIEPVRQEVLDGVERTLRAELVADLSERGRRDSHESMARILGGLDRGAENRFVSALEDRDPKSAERIRALMFVFDDLGDLDPGSVQTLLHAADKGVLALALKGAADRLRALFLANLSERAGRLLREDMEGLGPVRLKAVDEAQATIVALAKDLAARGEILIDGVGDDALVY